MLFVRAYFESHVLINARVIEAIHETIITKVEYPEICFFLLSEVYCTKYVKDLLHINISVILLKLFQSSK